jgi:4-hydroxybenzoate polyprenyltransferase
MTIPVVESLFQLVAIMYNSIPLENVDMVKRKRSVGALLTITALSSVAMFWLLWRYPLITGIFTLVTLIILFLLARTARILDKEEASDSESSAVDRRPRVFGLIPRVY